MDKVLTLMGAVGAVFIMLACIGWAIDRAIDAVEWLAKAFFAYKENEASRSQPR